MIKLSGHCVVQTTLATILIPFSSKDSKPNHLLETLLAQRIIVARPAQASGLFELVHAGEDLRGIVGVGAAVP
jgi:hypothetical protein